MCALHCAHLLHTILHRIGLTIFPLILQTIIIEKNTQYLWRKWHFYCTTSSFSAWTYIIYCRRVCVDGATMRFTLIISSFLFCAQLLRRLTRTELKHSSQTAGNNRSRPVCLRKPGSIYMTQSVKRIQKVHSNYNSCWWRLVHYYSASFVQLTSLVMSIRNEQHFYSALQVQIPATKMR